MTPQMPPDAWSDFQSCDEAGTDDPRSLRGARPERAKRVAACRNGAALGCLLAACMCVCLWSTSTAAVTDCRPFAG
jgi:hypothetical protein